MALPIVSRRGLLGCMIAEQDVIRLEESKRRLEMLLSYFQNRTEREELFVRQLEERLRGISAVLTPVHEAPSHRDARSC